MAVDNGTTVFAPLPDTTYRYTATPWSDSAKEYNGLERDGAVCTNEYGVAMTMSITAFANNTALNADPLVENGLTEFTANELVICQSKTAREAVNVLLSLIDTYGSSESKLNDTPFLEHRSRKSKHLECYLYILLIFQENIIPRPHKAEQDISHLPK